MYLHRSKLSKNNISFSSAFIHLKFQRLSSDPFIYPLLLFFCFVFSIFFTKYIAKFYFWYSSLWLFSDGLFSRFFVAFVSFFLANETSLMNSNAKQNFLNKVYLGSFITYFLCRHCISIYFRFKEIWVQKIKYLLNKNVNAA